MVAINSFGSKVWISLVNWNMNNPLTKSTCFFYAILIQFPVFQLISVNNGFQLQTEAVHIFDY